MDVPQTREYDDSAAGVAELDAPHRNEVVAMRACEPQRFPGGEGERADGMSSCTLHSNAWAGHTDEENGSVAVLEATSDPVRAGRDRMDCGGV